MSTIIHHQFADPNTLVLVPEIARSAKPPRFPRRRPPFARKHQKPVVAPRPTTASLEEQVACAKTTALRYREFAAMAGRPVKRIQMIQFAEKWEDTARTLEARRHGRQQPGELFAHEQTSSR